MTKLVHQLFFRSLPLSHSVAVCSLGHKLMADAYAVLESRKETSGDLDSNLQKITDTVIKSEQDLAELLLGFSSDHMIFFDLIAQQLFHFLLG